MCVCVQDIKTLQQSNEAKQQNINAEKELCLILKKQKDDQKMKQVRVWIRRSVSFGKHALVASCPHAPITQDKLRKLTEEEQGLERDLEEEKEKLKDIANVPDFTVESAVDLVAGWSHKCNCAVRVCRRSCQRCLTQMA